MEQQSAGDALLNNPMTTKVQCKTCGIIITGASDAFDHIDYHEGK